MLAGNAGSVNSSLNLGHPPQPSSRDRTPPNLGRLNLPSHAQVGPATPLNLSQVNFPQSFTKSSARERSPVPSLEQAVTEKLKAINDFQQLQKDVSALWQ